MTHAVLEGRETVFIKSVGFGFFIRIKHNRYGLFHQQEGKEILPTCHNFIWHCPETNRNQVWVFNFQNEVGIFDLIDRSWVAPVMFSQIFPHPRNPYIFTVLKDERKGTYNALEQKLTWEK